VLNAIHLRQYQEYYAAIEKIVTESTDSAHYEELAALNRAADVKPRILVAAPSNAGIDNLVLKIMSTRFVDGRGTQYSPSIVRVGAGTTSSRVKSVSLKEMVDGMIKQGSDLSKLDSIISTGRKNLKRQVNFVCFVSSALFLIVQLYQTSAGDQQDPRKDPRNVRLLPLR